MKPLSYISLATFLITGVSLGSFVIPVHATETAPAVVATVPVGPGPWGVAITPDSRRAFIGNSGVAGGGANVSVIDLDSRAVIQDVSTREGRSAGVAISPNGIYAYVANFTGDGNVSRIDASSYAVTESPLVNADALSLAVSPDSRFIYVVCEFGQTWRIDGSDFSASPVLLSSLPGGTFDIAVNATQQVYVGGYPAGQVRIIDDNVRFGALVSSGTAVALSPDGETAYVGDTSGQFYVFDLASTAWNIPIATYALGGDIRGIAVTPDGMHAYVTDKNGNTVRVLDLSNGDVLYTIPVGSGPQRVAISADGLTAVVTNNIAATISIIEIPAQPATGEPGMVPVAPLQQFAIEAHGSCDQIPRDFADFPGIGATLLHSRWGKSWAEWPNGGSGGFVCSRQPFFTNAGTWSVQ